MKDKISNFTKKNLSNKKVRFPICTILIILVIILIICSLGNKVSLTCEDAEKIALDKLEGGIITRCELERRRYEVTVIYKEYEYEFEIDGKSGKIINYDSEYIKEIKD